MARCRVELTRPAEREFDALPRDAQVRVNRIFDVLAENPRTHGAIKLHGPDKLYRIRAGDWRVLYEIRDAVMLVLAVKIGNRRDVYR